MIGSPQGTARTRGRRGLRGGGQPVCGNQQLLQEQRLFLVFSPVPNKPRAAGSLWVNAECSRDRKSGSVRNEFQPLQKGEARRGIFFGTVSLWQALVLSPKECSCVCGCVCVCVCVCLQLLSKSLFSPYLCVRLDSSAGSASQRWCPHVSVGAVGEDTRAAQSGLSPCVSKTV